MGDLAAILRRTVGLVGEASERHLPRSIGLALRFDLLNPRSVAFIEQHGANLIREVSEETRTAVRDVIRRAFEEGMPPRESAGYMRELVGLTRRQAQAVDNLRRNLTAGGAPLARARAQPQAYAERLPRKRAINIARTETIRAANMGQQLLWLQGVDRGLIDPGYYSPLLDPDAR